MKIKTMFIKNTIITLSILSGILINSQQIIPFRITKYNNIIVKTLVNDSLNLMFQISMEDASISPQRSRPAKSIVFKDEISENNSVKIGNLEWKNIRFYDNELTGQEADGKIGTGIFKGKTYQIDFDNNQFVIYDTLPIPQIIRKFLTQPIRTGKFFSSAKIKWEQSPLKLISFCNRVIPEVCFTATHLRIQKT
jgi:hypothetical protein